MFASRKEGFLLSCLLLAAISADLSGQTSPVIVELKEEPGTLFAARAEQQGQAVSEARLQAYRDGLRSGQDSFLATLTNSGIAFTVGTIEISDFDGGIAAAVEARYTLVFNGLALHVDPAGLPLIEAMPQVKAVHPDAELRVHLDRSVDYTRAPEVYGEVVELTPFDDFREGFEGQGTRVAVLDTGIEWSHEMFGGDPSPPRLGVLPETAVLNSNRKVIYYLPLVDGAVDDFGHGTHVSADAAGFLAFAPGPDGLALIDDDVRVHGVAPQARLMGTQPLGCGPVRLLAAARGGRRLQPRREDGRAPNPLP